MAKVCIILPTYNRAHFLPEALNAIAAQTYTDWQLVIIDDGSTDGTRELVERLAPDMPGPVRYIHQPNGGVAAARNRGLDEAAASGAAYIAFFDSDDLWLPHHLADCVDALDANPSLDWVFGAGRHVRIDTREVIMEDSFRPQGRDRSFLKLHAKAHGKVKIIDDAGALTLTIRENQFGGLQASVYRAKALKTLRFPPVRVGEDLAMAVMLIAQGSKLGYLDDVHVTYQVHDAQTSSANASKDALTKRIATQQAYMATFHWLLARKAMLPADARKALQERAINEQFWKLGYHLQWSHGRRIQALSTMFRTLLAHPSKLRLWATFLAMLGRAIVTRHRPSTPSAEAST